MEFVEMRFYGIEAADVWTQLKTATLFTVKTRTFEQDGTAFSLDAAFCPESPFAHFHLSMST
jgi:hypothetical protein